MINIKEKETCCGCMACVQKCPRACIEMVEDNEGFFYPRVNMDLCIDCHLCEKSCPVINQAEKKTPIIVYAATNNNENILKESSSGGIFTLLAEKILLEGGIVFGAAFNDKWEVCHIHVEKKEDLCKLRGSKYVQSRIGSTYKEAESFLKQNRKVLYSGTPCQIAGLKKYLRKDYDNLFCVDVICHGSPSPGIWKSYLETVLVRPKGVVGRNSVLLSLKEKPVLTGISFRDKRLGWQKYGFVLSGKSASKADRNTVLSSHISRLLDETVNDNLYMKGFLNNLYLRPSCYECPARHGKSKSDLLLGDFWGILRRHPEFYNPQGVSLVLAYSDKGEQLFKSIDCKRMEATYEDALDCNINIEKNETQPKNREAFFAAYLKNGIYAIDKYCKQLEPKLWQKVASRIKNNIKNLTK